MGGLVGQHLRLSVRVRSQMVTHFYARKPTIDKEMKLLMTVKSWLQKRIRRFSGYDPKAKHEQLFATHLPRFASFAYAFHQVGDVDGHIVEAGVGAGESLAFLSYLRDIHSPGRTILAYDSFRGFLPDAVDAYGNPIGGSGILQLDYVKNNLRLAGVDPDDEPIQFFPGCKRSYRCVFR